MIPVKSEKDYRPPYPAAAEKWKHQPWTGINATLSLHWGWLTGLEINHTQRYSFSFNVKLEPPNIRCNGYFVQYLIRKY